MAKTALMGKAMSILQPTPGAKARRSPGLKPKLPAAAVLSLALALSLAGCVRPPSAMQKQAATDSTPYQLPQQEVDSAYGHFLAARHARLNRDYNSAAEYYLRAMALDPDNAQVAQGAFLALLGAGHTAKAMELAPALQAMNPNDHLARITIAANMLMRRDYDSALAMVANGPQGGIHGAFNPLIAAWAEMGKGNAPAAKAALARLDRNPLFGGVHDHLKPLLLEALGLTDEALEAYAGYAERPERVGTRQTDGYSRLLLRLGRVDEARAVVQRSLDLNPENSTLQMAMKRLQQANATRPNAANNAAMLAPQLVGNAQDGFAESLFVAANAFGRNDGGELTELHLQLALALRPDLDDARILLADIYESRKQWDRAIATYAKVNQQGIYGEMAQTRIAVSTYEMGDQAAAIRMLRRTAAANRDDYRPLLTLADLYRQSEKWNDAAREYTAALDRISDIEPRHWFILFGRGIAYERSKQWPKAEPDMIKALELQPDQPMVLNYLGYTWVDLGLNIDAGTDMIKRAVALRPNDGAIVDSLGWAYYRRGRYDEAVVQLERAVELKGGDPVITDHLGDAYWKVGRRAEAQFQWRRALGLKPEAELEQQVKRKLEVGLDPVAVK